MGTYASEEIFTRRSATIPIWGNRSGAVSYLAADREQSAIWLRQAFVLESEPEYLCTNVEDEGRFVNHSSDPNTGFASTERPSVALRDIAMGEELTCDYNGLGSPQWYRDLCSSCQPMKLLESFLVETCICIVVVEVRKKLNLYWSCMIVSI